MKERFCVRSSMVRLISSMFCSMSRVMLALMFLKRPEV